MIVELFSIVEKDISDFLSHDNVLQTYKPSKPCAHVMSHILFPYQVYLFSQAEGDFSCLRTESIILEFYLLQLFPLCVRIITKSLTRILEKDVIPEVMSSLFETPLGQLLPYALSCLYIHNYSTYIGEHLSSEVEDLALLWCKLLTICRTEVYSISLSHSQHSLLHDNASITWAPLYTATYSAPIQSIPWYLDLLDCTVAVSTRYHYSCRFNSTVEPREDVRFLLESFMFSGGLKS